MTHPYDYKLFARCPEIAAIHGSCVGAKRKYGVDLWDQMTLDIEDIDPETGEHYIREETRKERDHRLEQAKAICRSCPALEACREWALTTPDPAAGDGRIGLIAGGLTLQERNGIRRHAIAIKHGTLSGYSTHYHRGERPCAACKTAWKEYKRVYEQERRAAS